MRTKIFFVVLFVVVLLLPSCDLIDKQNEATCYWDSPATVRMQLKGKVKTLSDEWQTYIFNESGNLVKTEDKSAQPGKAICNYTYDTNGVLKQTSHEDGTVTTYEYGNHGFYIPLSFLHIGEVGLYSALSKKTEKNSDYEFVSTYKIENGVLTITETQKFKGQSEPRVTSYKINYEGKFPKKYELPEFNAFMETSYQTNGMFNVYSEGWITENGRDRRTTTFLADNEFLLQSKWERKDYDGYTNTIIYTYNDKKDVVKMEDSDTQGNNSTITFTYVYDSHNNWVKKTSSDGNTETRTITYFK